MLLFGSQFNTVINKRRVIEGSSAGLFHEAIDELCNLENVCAYIKAGLKAY